MNCFSPASYPRWEGRGGGTHIQTLMNSSEGWVGTAFLVMRKCSPASYPRWGGGTHIQTLMNSSEGWVGTAFLAQFLLPLLCDTLLPLFKIIRNRIQSEVFKTKKNKFISVAFLATKEIFAGLLCIFNSASSCYCHLNSRGV